MEKFTVLTSVLAPLDRANVDTDQIIPKQFLKSVKRTGFGPFLFDEWRYLDRGELGMENANRPQNPDFVLNAPQYAGAKILLARDNFGCGSSREHAVWALMGYGFRAVLAPSFAGIFRGNAAQNGLLAAVVSQSDADSLFEMAREKCEGTVDLPAQTVQAGGKTFSFEIAAATKDRLLNGWDDIALTLAHADAVRAYEKKRAQEEPWLFSKSG